MKGQTFGEMYPKGVCMICKQPCSPEGMMHADCAVVYDDIQRNRFRTVTDNEVMEQLKKRFGEFYIKQEEFTLAEYLKWLELAYQAGASK